MPSIQARICLLKDDLINKIAAGEVVERPVSVVKELVENSIDAGSKRIDVEIREGGKKLIAVVDNGMGILREDLPIALKRHATSKISNEEDLFSIHSLGFRGEALASIASVAKLQILTRSSADSSGSHLHSKDDGSLSIDPIYCDVGTKVIVEDLFSRIPARLAFLKSNASEAGAIHDFMKQISLARPDIHFQLRNDQKILLDAVGVEDQEASANISKNGYALWSEDSLRQRFKELYDADAMHEAMLFASDQQDLFSWKAIFSSPGYEKSQSKEMHFFVNGRWVKDQGLRYAVLRGYHSHLLKQKYPVIYLMLNVRPEILDVNVHPAKTEIRLQYFDDIASSIARGIRAKLRTASFAESNSFFATDKESKTLSFPPLTDTVMQAPPIATKIDYIPSPAIAMRDVPVSSAPNTKRESWDLGKKSPSPLVKMNSLEFLENQKDIIPWRDLKYIGSFAKLYLCFSLGDEKMLVVDQHAFHERILYEKIVSDPGCLGGAQRLLIPEHYAFDSDVVDRLKQKENALKQLGFDWLVLSEADIEVTAVPSLLKNKNIAHMLQEAMSSSFDEESAVRECLGFQQIATIACHAAVRGGELLNEDQLNLLLAQAADVDFYHNCPHGRRVFKWWSQQEISKWFDR